MSEENDFFLKQMKGVTQIKKKNRELNSKTIKKNNPWFPYVPLHLTADHF